MTFQSFIFFALLISNYASAVTIRSPSHHNHFSKRSTLQNNGSGPCLTVSSNSNGAKVVVGSCSSTQWTFPSSGSGMIHVSGNKCLDVTNGQNVNGNKLQIWDCNDGPNQKFTLTNGEIQWKGTNKCIDLTNGSKAAGTQVQIWECASGNTNQKWSYPASSGSGSGSGSTKAPSGSPFGKSKILLAYPDDDLSELNNLAPSNVFYNWSPSIGALGSALGQGKVFLPQLWGWRDQGDFDSIIDSTDAPILLGMNEPNEEGQSNMDPGSGADLWRQSMIPARNKGHKVCSPATSGNPNGITWMKNFKQNCPECVFDYLCVHWYDTTFAKFQAWLEEWHGLYPDVQIIVTEFAPQNFNSGGQPSEGQVWAFYQQAIPWALSQEWIAAIAPYCFMQDCNINSNAKLMDGSNPNSLGKWILSQG